MSHNRDEPDEEDIGVRIIGVTESFSHDQYNSSSPGINIPGQEIQEDTSDWWKTNAVSRVTDYGFQDWVRNNPGNSNSLEGQQNKTAVARKSGLKMRLQYAVSRVTYYGFQTWVRNNPGTSNSLEMQLTSAMRDASHNPATQWLPLGQLESICPRHVVQSEFLRVLGISSPNIELYTDYVCGNNSLSGGNERTSRKIFAILTLMNELPRIKEFINAEIRDQNLPCRKVAKDGMEATFMLEKTSSSTFGSESTFCFHNWDPVYKQKFYQNQWSFVVPYFSRASDGTVSLYELDEPCIMPWLKTGEKVNGGFAEVTKFYMHPDHHAFNTDKVATKKLKAENKDNDALFRREFSNLKRVENKLYLLPLYAAYRQGKEYSFIIPWADGGSLKDLWDLDPIDLFRKVHIEPEPGNDWHQRARKVISWVAGQFSGLTGENGLGFLHDTKSLISSRPGLIVPEENDKNYGIHGDIKPANILYFKQDHSEDGSGLGLFKISDFGLTGFHSALTRTREGPTGPHSPGYRSPEYGMYDRGTSQQDISKAYLSRKYDIWSLGCVLLQFLTWLISGPEGLTQFMKDVLEDMDKVPRSYKEAKFFSITETGAAQKASVENQFQELHTRVEKGHYLHDCLRFIQDRVLVIDVKKRADCKEVHKALSAYHGKCLQDDDYAVDFLPTFQEPRTSRPLTSRPAGPEVHFRIPSPISSSTNEQDPVINHTGTETTEEKTSKFKRLKSHLKISRLKRGSEAESTFEVQ